jgi:hypothetical protein
VQLLVENPGDYVIRQSLAPAPYQPGKGQLFEASFANLTVEEKVIKRIGAFTSDPGPDYDLNFDGFFLEADGISDHTFNIYNNGALIDSVGSANWLTTDYNYSDIDWSMTQLMMVDYQWLGVGRVRFYMVIEGTPRLFYEYTHANRGGVVGAYMNFPNKPIRHEIRVDPTAAPSITRSLVEICSQISSEGSVNDVYKIGALPPAYTDVLTIGPRYAVMGFRTAEYGVSARIKNISLLEVGSRRYMWQIMRNPDVRGVRYTWAALPNHPRIEYAISTGDAVTLGGGEIIMASYIGNGGALFNSGPLNLEDSLYTGGMDLDGNAQEFWLVVTPLGGSCQFRATMNVEYYD